MGVDALVGERRVQTRRNECDGSYERSVTLERVRSIGAWDRLVAEQGGSFFHRYRFLSTISEGLDFSLDLRVVSIDGEAVGVAPIVSKRRGPFITVNWLPFPYLGPLVPQAALGPTMSALSRHERRARSIWSQHMLATYRLQAVPGYVSSDYRTFVVPLEGRSDDDLLGGMSSRRRSAMRRAERNGLRVREATRSEVTELLPALSNRVFEQQGMRAPYSREVFRLVWERLGGHPDVLFQTAEIDGTPAAVQISFAGGPTGLAWVVGREQDQAGSDAYASMMWRTMCWARDRGCREFDLVGAPTEGIANYKRGLGADERLLTVLNHQPRVRNVAERVVGRLRRPEGRMRVPALLRRGT